MDDGDGDRGAVARDAHPTVAITHRTVIVVRMYVAVSSVARLCNVYA